MQCSRVLRLCRASAIWLACLSLFLIPFLGGDVFSGVGARAEKAASVAVDEGRLVIETAGGPRVFRVEVADDVGERSKGLMFRRSLDRDAGMLFDFFRNEEVSFWMKNTYVALDMIFIRADGTIAHIAKNTVPLSERPVSSGEPVRFVLEVVAGTSARLGIRPGDRIRYPRVEAVK